MFYQKCHFFILDEDGNSSGRCDVQCLASNIKLALLLLAVNGLFGVWYWSLWYLHTLVKNRINTCNWVFDPVPFMSVYNVIAVLHRNLCTSDDVNAVMNGVGSLPLINLQPPMSSKQTTCLTADIIHESRSL